MYTIAALNEIRQPWQTGRIPLRPGKRPNNMRTAARHIRFAANVKEGGHLQNRNNALPLLSFLLQHLEWITRLPILFRKTPNAIE
jgi:hypothetical protein